MNIRQYYEQAAAVALNASLAAFIPAIIILFYSFIITKIFSLSLLIIPFLIYSFFSFQAYLLHKNRALSVNREALIKAVSVVDFLQESNLLLHFLPSPSLRLLFFNPSGVKVGELRDQSMVRIRWFLPYFSERFFQRRFIFYNHKDEPLAQFHLSKDRVDIGTVEGKHVATVFKLQKRKSQEFLVDGYFVHINKSGIPPDYSFVTAENMVLARIQRGFMPLEWGKIFVNPNTPILNISALKSEKERYQLLALLIFLYAYVNH